MNLLLIRELCTDTETVGSLYIDGEFFSYTLEDVPRNKKLNGDTCIPFGTYKVQTSMSPRFKRDLPLVWNTDRDLTVKNKEGDSWAGIRIHGGNNHLHTLGCILVAKNRYINVQPPVKFTYEGTTISTSNYIQGSMIDPLVKLLKTGIHTLKIVYSKDWDDQRKTVDQNMPVFKVGGTYNTNDVCEIINKLNLNGILTRGDRYDLECAESVKSFQKSKGLTVDGECGKETIKKMNLIWDGYRLITIFDYLNNIAIK